CLLFLGSGLEYEWPRQPGPEALPVLAACAGAAGAFVTLAFLAAALGLLLGGRWVLAGLAALCGGRGCVASGLALVWAFGQNSPAWRAYRAAGDWEVWPFLRQADYERVAAAARVLSRQQGRNSGATA